MRVLDGRVVRKPVHPQGCVVPGRGRHLHADWFQDAAQSVRSLAEAVERDLLGCHLCSAFSATWDHGCPSKQVLLGDELAPLTQEAA